MLLNIIFSSHIDLCTHVSKSEKIKLKEIIANTTGDPSKHPLLILGPTFSRYYNAILGLKIKFIIYLKKSLHYDKCGTEGLRGGAFSIPQYNSGSSHCYMNHKCISNIHQVLPKKTNRRLKVGLFFKTGELLVIFYSRYFPDSKRLGKLF